MKEMLSGIKVLDITNNIAGPAAAELMAAYGADVIHIEKPLVGDDGRFFPPVVDGESLGFARANSGKRSVVLDMKDPRAIEIIKLMVQSADVVVESFRPGIILGGKHRVARLAALASRF